MKKQFLLTKVLTVSILVFGIGSQAQDSNAVNAKDGSSIQSLLQAQKGQVQNPDAKTEQDSDQAGNQPSSLQVVGIDHTGIYNLEALVCADTFTGELTDLAAFERGTERITIVGNNYSSREVYRGCTVRSRANIFFNTNDTYDFINHQYTSVTNGSCRVGLDLADRPANDVFPESSTRRVATGQRIPNFTNEYFSSLQVGFILVDVEVENFQSENPDAECAKLYVRED